MVTVQCDAPGKGDPLLDTDGDGDHDDGDEANNRESASYAVSSCCLARQGEPGRDRAIKGQETSSAWCELYNSATPTQVSRVKYREIFRGSFAGMISLMISDCPSQTEAVFMDPIKNICTMVHCSAPFLLSQLTP